MKRHWRLWLLLVALLIAGGLFLHPSVRWPVTGWARGEAFYQGMPTSYWHNEIKDRYEERIVHFIASDGKCGFEKTHWVRQPTAWEEWFDKLFVQSGPGERIGRDMLKTEEEAIPVLKELFVSGDIKVRRFAAEKLSRLGHPSLYEAAESEDLELRQGTIAAWKLTYRP